MSHHCMTSALEATSAESQAQEAREAVQVLHNVVPRLQTPCK